MLNAQAEVADYRASAELTVGELCGRYIQYLRAEGRKPLTTLAVEHKLRMIVGPIWDAAADLTAARAKALYVQLAAGDYAAASHHKALHQAKAVWRWAVREKLARVNPWADVRPMGRANKGKPQLNFDEARQLIATCLPLIVEQDGALAVLLALLCGLRRGEILGLTVRSVDNDGKMLRIYDAKTKAGVRPLDIPTKLRPAIQIRTKHRDRSALLLDEQIRFSQPGTWIHGEVRRYCQLAGVPVVCPHSLRGTFAAVAVDAAEVPMRVAAALGHESFGITKAHYVPGEVIDRAEQRQRGELYDKN